ncbi:unnamed protein product [Polarella glacialis]|uniref:Uncharacterized protein n=1 Tax=Polarella glacialis TaxID=89957 RepID=A0A813IGG3_POLGL|nr:unnamed protein product [Polarella glacialis]
MFLKLHVVSCLDLMIDDFPRQYAEHGDAEQGILQRSLIQATLNQASNRLEGSFLISFTAIVAGFATLTADLFSSAEMLDRGQACSGEESWLLQPLLMTFADLRAPPGCPHLTQMWSDKTLHQLPAAPPFGRQLLLGHRPLLPCPLHR